MKKKLKVKKAFAGKMMRAATAQGKRVINPGRRPIINFGGPRGPKSSAVVNPVRPGMQPSSDMILPAMVGATPQPIKNIGGMGPLPNNLGPIQPSSQIAPNSPRSLPFASAVGPSMQGVGDPRLGATTIPGNQLQMQMRGPQQAAPVQPVPAMKKGGMVRGGRKETKGLRKAKLY
jgi:hypothetical protein